MKCKLCSKEDGSVVQFGTIWICATCLTRGRKLAKRDRKAAKRRASLAKYYEALVRPDLRGLKGARK